MSKQFTDDECKILIEILNQPRDEFLTTRKLVMNCAENISNFCTISETHPNFIKIMKYLKGIGAIVIVKQIGPSKIISINKRKVKNVLEKQTILDYYQLNWFRIYKPFP